MKSCYNTEVTQLSLHNELSYFSFEDSYEDFQKTYGFY